jgi:pimeloyl-ACP methyl ester carboxylesterase
MDDVRAVMDAAGSQRAFLLGLSEGGLLAALFATPYPARTAGVVFFSSDVRGAWPRITLGDDTRGVRARAPSGRAG